MAASPAKDAAKRKFMIGILMIEFGIIKMILLSQRSKLSGKNEVGMIQTHGNRVTGVSKKDAGRSIDSCDGLLTNDPEIFLTISVADCIPLALFDSVTGSIGLVHAGWRGLDGKIIKNAVDLMIKNFSVKPENLQAEIGPHICQKHYEVKGGVAARFFEYPDAVRHTKGKMFLDLAKVAEDQLENCGIPPKNIKVEKHCTYEDPSLPSYRRGDMKKRVYYLLRVPNSS